MHISAVDTLIVILYLLGMMFLGVYFARKNKNTEEYFLGGRSFGGIIIGISLVGASISSITFLAFPADAFKTSWIRFLTAFMMPIAVLVASRIFLPFFKQGNTTSAYEFLETRFGPSIRFYAAIVFLFAQLVRLAVILYLLSFVLYEITGLNPVWCVLISGCLVAFYTVTGGINAVIWADVVQTIILVIGGIMIMAIILYKLPGGLGEIFSVAVEHNKLSFADVIDGKLVPIPWGFSLQNKTILMMFFLGLTGWLTAYCSDQNIIQRYCASKSTSEARKALWISTVISLSVWSFFMFLGTSLFVFFNKFPTQQTTEMLEGIRKAEQILPYFIMNYLPKGILGLVVAAILAAAMSSLDSSINAVSTIFVVDIYRRHLCRNREDRHYLKVAWFVAVVASALMILGSIILINTKTETLQDTASIIAAFFTGGMLGIYIIGFFTKIGDARAIWSGIICTWFFTLWTTLSQKSWLPDSISISFDFYYTGLIGNIIMFLVGFTMAVIFRKFAKIQPIEVE